MEKPPTIPDVERRPSPKTSLLVLQALPRELKHRAQLNFLTLKRTEVPQRRSDL